VDWQELQEKVDDFAREVNPGLVDQFLRAGGEVVRDVFFGGPPWKEWWAKAKAIQEGFDSRPRFPTRQAYQECREKFQEARTALFNASRIDRENKAATSQMHKGLILEQVGRARVYGNPDTSREAREILKAAGRELGTAMTMLHDRKDGMLAEHKGECHAAITEMKADHDERWRIIKGERERYTADAIGRTEANLTKNRERHAKTSDALARQRANEAKLVSQLEERSSRSRYDRLQGWLDECRSKISDMEESLRTLDEWIRQDEERLDKLRRK